MTERASERSSVGGAEEEEEGEIVGIVVQVNPRFTIGRHGYPFHSPTICRCN